MHTNRTKAPLTDIELRTLGEGQVGYMRRVSADDLKRSFPGLPPMPAMPEGLRLWGLFAADGSPLVLSDERDNVVQAAETHDLVTVSVH